MWHRLYLVDFTVSIVTDGEVECFSFLPKFRMKLVVAVPDFPLSTRKARAVLPEQVPMKDAVNNIGRASMLIASLCRGNEKFLKNVFDDALHQPYRAALIPGMYEVFAAARKAGAIGANLSGAGPCLIAYTLETQPL
jgi:homoserine kinase